jgi:hypothetical protein
MAISSGGAAAVGEPAHEDAAGPEAEHQQGVGQRGLGARDAEVGLHGRQRDDERPHADAADGADQPGAGETPPRMGRVGLSRACAAGHRVHGVSRSWSAFRLEGIAMRSRFLALIAFSAANRRPLRRKMLLHHVAPARAQRPAGNHAGAMHCGDRCITPFDADRKCPSSKARRRLAQAMTPRLCSTNTTPVATTMPPARRNPCDSRACMADTSPMTTPRMCSTAVLITRPSV